MIHPNDLLTLREQDVARLVARGAKNRAIAHVLGITPRTVESHLTRIFDKLGMESRTQLVIWAVQHGLVDTTECVDSPDVSPPDDPVCL